MNGAIDTLRVRLTGFEISPNADLEVDPGTKNLKTNEIQGEITLYRDSNYSEIRGKKAYCNTDLFQFDLSGKGAYVKYSVPLVHNNGLNNILPPKSEKEFRSVMERVQCSLEERGIKTDILSGIPSRVDLFKMIESEYEYANYGIVYSSLSPARKPKRDYGYDSHFWKNTQGQFLIYNKYQESIDKHKQSFNLPYNSHRHELRFTTGKSAKTNLKTNSVRELMNEYEYLPDKTAKHLAKIFSLKPEEFQRGFIEDIRNNLSQYIKIGSNPLQSLASDVGRINIIDTIGIPAYLNILKEYFPKGTISKEKKKFDRVLLQRNIQLNNGADLYSEIREKAIDPGYVFSLVA